MELNQENEGYFLDWAKTKNKPEILRVLRSGNVLVCEFYAVLTDPYKILFAFANYLLLLPCYSSQQILLCFKIRITPNLLAMIHPFR